MSQIHKVGMGILTVEARTQKGGSGIYEGRESKGERRIAGVILGETSERKSAPCLAGEGKPPRTGQRE